MHRRDLIRLIGASALSPFVLPIVRKGFSNSAYPHGLTPGLQLYSVRTLLEKDFEGTLAALADIGYRQVEFAGLYRHEPAAVRSILDRYRLRAIGGHVDLTAITDTLDQTITEARTLGYEFVVMAWIDEDKRTRAGYHGIAEALNRAGDKLRHAGLTLAYHNHLFEFAPLDPAPPGSPRCGYDILIADTNPDLVAFELDLFWIRKGGGDALAYFHEHPGRFRLVHVKDMAPDGAMVDLGRGAMDWPTLLRAASQAGVRYFIAEHDQPQDPLQFARTAFEYLSSLRL